MWCVVLRLMLLFTFTCGETQLLLSERLFFLLEVITGERPPALGITFVALHETFFFIRSGFCARQLTLLLYTSPGLLFICSVEIFFLDFAAGLASSAAVKRLPRTKSPDGPEHDAVTCTQACFEHACLHRQRVCCIHNCWLSGLEGRPEPPALLQGQGASGLPPVFEARPPHPETFGGWEDLPSRLPQVRPPLSV